MKTIYVITDSSSGEILLKTEDWYEFEQFIHLEISYKELMKEKVNFNIKTYHSE